MQATWNDIDRTFAVTNTGHDSGDWICRVIEWEGQVYIRHEVGEYAGNITPANTFSFEDCMWIDPPNSASPLTRAVMVVRAAGELDLQFEDLTDKFWGWDDRDSLVFHETDVAILEDTGDYYHFEVRHKVEEDNNYIRFYIDNGCGDSYDVVFDKSKRLEVE